MVPGLDRGGHRHLALGRAALWQFRGQSRVVPAGRFPLARKLNYLAAPLKVICRLCLRGLVSLYDASLRLRRCRSTVLEGR